MVTIIIFCLFCFLSITSCVKLPFTPNLGEIWAAGLYPSSLWGREAAVGYRHTRGLAMSSETLHTHLTLQPHAQQPFLHLVCNLSFWLLDLVVLKKWKTACAVIFLKKNPKQIITNYMSAHIWAFPALISIILWCNGISWVSSTLSLNVTLGRRSDLPWRWLVHCSSVDGIDRSWKAPSRTVTAG